MPSNHPSPEDWRTAADLISRASSPESFDDLAGAVGREIAALLSADTVVFSVTGQDDEPRHRWSFGCGDAPTAGGQPPNPAVAVSHLSHSSGAVDVAHRWSLSAHRSGRAFGEREDELARFLGHHLGIAALLRDRGASSQLARTLRQNLQRTDLPLAMLDATGRVQELSFGAQQLLAESGPADASACTSHLEALWRECASLGPAKTDAVTAVNLGPHLRGLALWLPPSGTALLLQRAIDPAFQLTRREREILAWLTEGKTNSDIAQLLGLSPRSVERHCGNLFAKLGVRDRLGAVSAVTDRVNP